MELIQKTPFCVPITKQEREKIEKEIEEKHKNADAKIEK